MALISTWTLVISRIPDNLSRRLISQSESTCEGVLLLQTTPFWLLVLVSFIKFHYLLLFCGQVKETVCTLQRPLPPPLMTSLFLNLARFWAQLIQSEIHSHGSNSKTMSINKNKQKTVQNSQEGHIVSSLLVIWRLALKTNRTLIFYGQEVNINHVSTWYMLWIHSLSLSEPPEIAS